MRRGEKLRRNLAARIKSWENIPKNIQFAYTKPGSEHK